MRKDRWVPWDDLPKHLVVQTCICLGQRFTNVSSENNQVLSYSVRVNVYKCLAYHVPRSDVCCGREQCFPVYSIYTDWWISHNNLYKIANERQWHRGQSLRNKLLLNFSACLLTAKWSLRSSLVINGFVAQPRKSYQLQKPYKTENVLQCLWLFRHNHKVTCVYLTHHISLWFGFC